MLEGKKIILGVTGSIAAYKSVILTRLLIKAGAEVKVIMTPAAAEFVSPLTFSTLSQNDVHTQIFDQNSWNNHVELGLWADLFLIAPATAATLAKLAHGLSDNMLVATYLSAKCPVILAPAMDLDMWKHPSTQNNLQLLQDRGNHIIDVEDGFLASGLSGKGRLAEPEKILERLEDFFSSENTDLANHQILITAGPTYEYIDPVRFIGNPSSGKMGIALAKASAQMGANVQLVLGPSNEPLPSSNNINVHRVISAEDMYNKSLELFPTCKGAIFAAAVSDYTPKVKHDKKVKKAGGMNALELKRTTDIAESLGKIKTSEQWTVGFALETNNEFQYALQKLKKKNFDLIVLNSLQDKGAGFQKSTNKVTIIKNEDKYWEYKLKEKRQVAKDILNTIVNEITSKSTRP